MAIYTRFGSKVSELISAYKDDNKVTWLTVKLEDGEIREWADYEFKADGGLREIMDAIAALTAPTPAANTETASAKAVKLSAAQDDAVRQLAQYKNVPQDGFIDNLFLNRVTQSTIVALGKKGIVELKALGNWKVYYLAKLTDAGRQYATERGWLASANSEPQADDDDEPIIMSDADKEDLRQRSDAMRAERKATKNTQDVPASEIHEDAQPEGVLTDDERAVLEYLDCDEPFSWSEIYRGMKSLRGNALDAVIDGLEAKGFIDYDKEEIVTRYYPTQTGRAAIAQPAPVDGGSDEPLHVTIMNQLSAKIEDGDEHAFTCTCGAYFVEGTGELCGDCVSKLRTEIRTLESKLAAAAAALEAIAKRKPSENPQPDPDYDFDVLEGEAGDNGRELSIASANYGYGADRVSWQCAEIAEKALAKLAAHEQSGAGEG